MNKKKTVPKAYRPFLFYRSLITADDLKRKPTKPAKNYAF